MSTFYNPEGPENQALEAEFPFIFVMLRPKAKLKKGERKALEALSGRVVVVDDLCPDNAVQRGFSAFDDFTIKCVIRSADWTAICPTDNPLSAVQISPDAILAAEKSGHKVVMITTTQDQYANWLKQVMQWRRPGVEVITMVFPKLNVDDHAEGSNASEASLSGKGRA